MFQSHICPNCKFDGTVWIPHKSTNKIVTCPNCGKEEDLSYLCNKFSNLSEEEMDTLTRKYGLRFRTATEFGGFDDRTRKWIMRLMEIAYEKGKAERK